MMSIRSCSLFLLTVLTAVSLFAPEAQGQGLSCPQVVGIYGQIKKDFRHTRDYTKVISEIGEIKDQCNLGTCTFMATASHLEQDFKRRTGKTLKISTEHLAYKHWLKESIETLRYELDNPDEIEPNSVPEINADLGSNILNAHLRVYSFGIMPSSAWTLGTSFQSGRTVVRIEEFVKNITARAKWEMRNASSDKTKELIVEKAEKQIYDVFENMIGVIPSEFVYEGKTYTPFTFADEFFPKLKKNHTRIYVKEYSERPDSGYYNSNGDLRIESDIESIEAVAKSIIDRGHAVFLSFGYDKTFFDPKTGIMSIEAFHFPEWAAPLNEEQAHYFGVKKGGHAVQIVGYDLDPQTNKVRKWLIKNSWGESSGDRGFIHMYNDYFKRYVKNISFYSELNVPLPEFIEKGNKRKRRTN